MIACDPRRHAFLLGPTIARGIDVMAATPVGPDQGSTQWGVLVTLDATGRVALSRYTARHNADATPAGGPGSCGRAGTPCADFVAFVVDGVVVSAPVTLAPITGDSLQILGNFTQNSAALLAAELAQGPLPVPIEFHSLR
jgi:preprotein translocase subunit SecD